MITQKTKMSENLNVKNSISDTCFKQIYAQARTGSNHHTSLKLLIPSSSSSGSTVGGFVRGDNLLFLPEI